jgi:hypothetical protein
VHVAGLTSNLPEFFGVDNWFWSGIHVALTARGELYSGFRPRLEEAQRGDPQRHEQHKPPCSRGSETQERGGHPNCQGQSDNARFLAPSFTARPDVRDGGH